MSEREAFMRAVIAEPDDDRPRLIFSDWLQDHGEPERAEFIRVQVELARGGGQKVPCRQCNGNGIHSVSKDPVKHKGSCRGGGRRVVTYRITPTEDVLCRKCNANGYTVNQSALRRRERKLLTFSRYTPLLGGRAGSVGEAWLPPFMMDVIVPPAGSHSVWRRGFLTELSCRWEDFSRRHAAILESCPIRNAKDGLVRLTTRPEVGYEFDDARLWWGGRLVSAHAPSPGRGCYDAANILACLATGLPGVRFELPPVPQQATPLDLAQTTLRSLGRIRFAELLTGRLSEYPALAHLLRRDRVLLESGHGRGGWLHATANFQITDEDLVAARGVEGVLRLIEGGRTRTVEAILALLEQAFQEQHGPDAQGWRMAILEGQWLRETAVRDHGRRAAIVHIDATYRFEPVPAAALQL